MRMHNCLDFKNYLSYGYSVVQCNGIVRTLNEPPHIRDDLEYIRIGVFFLQGHMYVPYLITQTLLVGVRWVQWALEH
jgi:hypothetical protein